MEREFTINVVRVFVHDWERALLFYTEQLGIPTTFRSDELGWAQLDTGEANLAIERISEDEVAARGLVGRFVGVSLLVDDIDTTHRRLVEAGVEFLSAPVKQPWGGTLCHFLDPDGNTLTLLGS